MLRRTTLLAVLCALLAACGGDDKQAATDEKAADSGSKLNGKIGVLLPDSATSDRWEKADRRFFVEAFTKAGLKKDDYIINNAQGDKSQQRAQAEQAINAGAKTLLLVNLDSGSGAAIVDDAQSKGVKVIDYDRLTENGNSDYYVSGDAVEAGRLQGEGLLTCLGDSAAKPARVAILDGAPTDSFSGFLIEGYDPVLEKAFGDGTLEEAARQEVPNWDVQKALTIFEQMLQKEGNKIDAVLAANDGLANAVVSALKARKLDMVPLTGLDGTTEAVQHILAGEQCMTVYFSIREQAALAGNLAVELAQGKKPSGITGETDNGKKKVPTILLKPVAVTKDNVADTVIADDFTNWKDVCVGEYEKHCPENR